VDAFTEEFAALLRTQLKELEGLLRRQQGAGSDELRCASSRVVSSRSQPSDARVQALDTKASVLLAGGRLGGCCNSGLVYAAATIYHPSPHLLFGFAFK